MSGNYKVFYSGNDKLRISRVALTLRQFGGTQGLTSRKTY